METDRDEKKTESRENDAPEGPQQPKVTWDDSNMRSFYSNATSVVGTREEIVLVFGMNQAWHAGQKEVKVQLMDRVVLSPFTAKRLANLLNNVLQDYESRFGALGVEQQRPSGSSLQ